MTNKTTLHQYLTEILGAAFLQTMYMIIVPVSYTPLDVYKRLLL